MLSGARYFANGALDLETLLKHLRQIAADGNKHWQTLPPAAYHSPALFELERSRVFKANWFCIGRADQVPEPGDYLAVEVVGEPVVLVRQHDRSLRVLSNVCRHRWMKVCGSAGHAATLVCPYHSWTYELDGHLKAAPEMRETPGFNVDEVCLPAIRHTLWQGFVYINLDGRADPLGPQLEIIDERVAEFGLVDWRVAASVDCGEYPWDWKVMQDNGECYHHLGAHMETFEPNYPAREVTTTSADGWTMQVSPVRKGRCRKGLDGKEYAPGHFTPVAGLKDWQRTSFMLVYVLPNFFIYLQADMGMKLRVFPLEAGRIHLVADILLPPHAFDEPGLESGLEAAISFFNRFNDEDEFINTRVQRGTASEFAKPAPLSHLEQHNRHVAWWTAAKLTSPER